MPELQVPWDFSTEPDPETAVPNLPTKEGRELGAKVAAIADRGREILESKGLRPGVRCDDCAFTKGTDPNGSIETLGDAVKCVVEGIPFRCHKGTNPGERWCGGWLDAIAHPSLQEAPRG